MFVSHPIHTKITHISREFASTLNFGKVIKLFFQALEKATI